MNDVTKQFLLLDQLKIMGYGESDTSGCWLKLQVDADHMELLRGRKGEMVEVAIRLLDNAGEYVAPDVSRETPKGPYGAYWAQLFKAGTFHAPDVLAAIGSDDDFQEWVRRHHSCLSGRADWDEDLGEPRCEFAHVRRVSEGSGTAVKPPYFGVPLTHEEHRWQHDKGEIRTLAKFAKATFEKLDKATSDCAAEWFQKQANKYRFDWASNALAAALGHHKGRSHCPPDVVLEWARNRDLERFFPEPRED
jgi:hypothetical protein